MEDYNKVFSSLIFLIYFLPFTLLGYYLVNPKLRNIFLLIASMFFYAYGEIDFLPIMCISILVNYLFGLLADKFRKKKPAAYIIIVLMVVYRYILRI